MAERENRPMLKCFGIIVACVTATTCGCSSSDGDTTAKAAATDVQAACKAAAGMGVSIASGQSSFAIQRDADRAATEDPQWKGFAADVDAFRAAAGRWRDAHPLGSGDITDLDAMWKTVLGDCKSIAAGT